MKTKSKTKKVIQSGPSLIIILPREFVKSSGIKKGDIVGITYNSILAIVNPKKMEEEQK